MGTVGYMSPEQVQGLSASQASDIFSFGAVLYEMLSGQRAFRGATAVCLGGRSTASAGLTGRPTANG